MSKSILERAISLGSRAQDQMSLYIYLSKCCTLSASEVKKMYSEEVLCNTCCTDLYASIIVENYSTEELATLFLRGEEIYSSIVSGIMSETIPPYIACAI